MIRNNIIAGTVLAVVLALNGLAILRLNQRYTEYLNQTLVSQSRLCGEYMETTLVQFSSDIDHELQRYNTDIFNDSVAFQEASQSLQLFYAKYRDLITRISIYDNQKNFYGLYLDPGDDISKQDDFVVDSFATRRQKPLSPVEELKQDGTVLEYHYPYFDLGRDVVIGNVVVQLDLQHFTDIVFNLYSKSSSMSWQWVLNEEGQVIIDDFGADSVLVDNLGMLADSVRTESSGMLEHDLYFNKGKRTKVYTAYYPVSIYDKKVGIMFSAGKGQIFKYYLSNNVIASVISQILATGLVIYLLVLLGRKIQLEKKLKVSEIVLR